MKVYAPPFITEILIVLGTMMPAYWWQWRRMNDDARFNKPITALEEQQYFESQLDGILGLTPEKRNGILGNRSESYKPYLDKE